jgi:type IV pilus assembly protein PilW
MTLPARNARKSSGFSLVELMVALALGLLLTVAMATVYLSSKTAFSRQQQLSSLQQSVRIAFEYLSSDARMVGHMGCYTGLPAVAPEFNSALAAGSVATNYAVGVDGYEYKNPTAGAFTLGSNAPADVTAATNWETNVSTNGITTIPVATIAGAGNGLTPGSDVLVIRTVAGRPVRLAANANTGANQSAFTIETVAASTGKCSNGTTDKVSGFCANSHGLIASCTRARVFQVNAITAGASPAPSTLTLSASMGGDPEYTPEKAEVFPMQTIAYYVKRSSSGTTTSLYRRIFDGDNANGLEQELIEGVENLQVRYGIDTTAPDADGIVDKYVEAKGATAADSVNDWNKVVAVRMGLLIRSTVAVEADVAVGTTGVVNGVTVTYPAAGSKYDRRVFTTTVAVRNKISYF